MICFAWSFISLSFELPFINAAKQIQYMWSSLSPSLTHAHTYTYTREEIFEECVNHAKYGSEIYDIYYESFKNEFWASWLLLHLWNTKLGQPASEIQVPTLEKFWKLCLNGRVHCPCLIWRRFVIVVMQVTLQCFLFCLSCL